MIKLGKEIPFPYREVSKDLLLLNSVSQFLIGLIVLFIGTLFVKKYLERRTQALKWVSLTYLAFGFSVFIGSWQGLIAWWQYENVTNPNPLVYGLPLFIDDLSWPFNAIAYVINMFSLIFLMMFIRSVFEKPGRKFVHGYVVVGSLWILYALYQGIFVYIPEARYKEGGSSMGIIGLISFLLLGTLVHALLAYHAYRARQGEKDVVIRDGLTLIMLAGLTVLLAYVVFVVNGLFTLNLDFLAWLIGAIAVVFVYLGFTLPEWFRRWSRSRVSSD